jgi:hypothetical protein
MNIFSNIQEKAKFGKNIPNPILQDGDMRLYVGKMLAGQIIFYYRWSVI